MSVSDDKGVHCIALAYRPIDKGKVRRIKVRFCTRRIQLTEDRFMRSEPEAESEVPKDNYLFRLTLMERNGEEGLEDNLISTWLISSLSHTAAGSPLHILSNVNILLQASQSKVKEHGVKSEMGNAILLFFLCVISTPYKMGSLLWLW